MRGSPDRLRRPPAWLFAATGVGAAGLLWVLAGWSGTVPAVGLAVALVVALLARVVGALLPREGRWIADRAGILAGTGALVVLVVQSSVWAVLVALGLLGLALAFAQPPRARRTLGWVGVVLVTIGTAGVLVAAAVARSERAAAYDAASERSRAQLLPDSPADALVTLMDAVAQPDDAGCYLFTDAGRAAFSAAYDAPDCATALRTGGVDVVDADAYPRVEHDSIVMQIGADDARAVVDGCAVRWRPTLDELLNGRRPGTPEPGPRLARIAVEALDGGTGWIITEFSRCP
ncbi:MAG: hypothetical protein ACRDRK_16480 [Pseudonocardia sp.]